MHITTETFGDVLVVHTPDELTDETHAAVLDALEAPLAAGQNRIVLQMDRTELFDSMGLTALVDLHAQVREQGGNVKVCGLPDAGRKIFEVTRLDRRFDVFDSLIDAVGSFR
jgi:anti-sigma B factor antagonist